MTLLDHTRPAFATDRLFERAKTLAVSSVLCLGRHTITGLLTTCGQQFVDWSAVYRLFERERIDLSAIEACIRTQAIELLEPHHPVVVLLDDTLLHKRGKQVAGTSWHRDPLGPQFQANLIWSQRFLQVSLAIPEQRSADPDAVECRADTARPARAVPIHLAHCPSPRKPARTASAEHWQAYHAKQRQTRISARGAASIQMLRQQLDADPAHQPRPLIACVDGSYTNHTVFSTIPERTTIIGRIRKDACLYALPSEDMIRQRGRTRRYGTPLPTPEQCRQDDHLPWQAVRVFAAGHHFTVQVKTLAPVRWRAAGGNRDMRLVIIRPLAYRPYAAARTLYREPGYLLCSDLTLDVTSIVQYYLWRWGIETNFRDEKTLLGTGEAQVRIEQTVESVPRFLVCAYAALLLSDVISDADQTRLPAPRWQRRQQRIRRRRTTSELIRQARGEFWARGMGLRSFSDFVQRPAADMKSEKIVTSLASAVCYATR